MLRLGLLVLLLFHMRDIVFTYGNSNVGMLGVIKKYFGVRLVSNRRKYDNISDVLRNLDWLNSQHLIAYFDMCMLQIIFQLCPPEIDIIIRYSVVPLSNHAICIRSIPEQPWQEKICLSI